MIWLNLIPRWVLVVVIAALMATLFLLKLENTQLSIEIEKGKTYVAKIEAAVAQANADAAKKAAQSEAQARQAEAVAAVRERSLRADLTGARTELDRLRSAVASTQGTYGLRSSGLSIASNLDTTDIFPELLLQCSSRLVEVAGEADQWKSDAIKLYEAWPGGRIEQH